MFTGFQMSGKVTLLSSSERTMFTFKGFHTRVREHVHVKMSLMCGLVGTFRAGEKFIMTRMV